MSLRPQIRIQRDVVFAWGYGFLLTGLLGLLTLRLPAAWQRVGKVLMWAPLLASAFDCLEDLALYQLAMAPAGSDFGLVPLLAGTFDFCVLSKLRERPASSLSTCLMSESTSRATDSFALM